MEASYSIIRKESEYRISLTPMMLDVLSETLQNTIRKRGIDISELIIDRVCGESTTGQDILHDITGWVADIFAANPNMIVYYSCDDMMPIPSRNNNSGNKELPVNEYRSRLFSHIFESYMSSHQVSGVTNTPIRLDNYDNGKGYSIFIHFIARNLHEDIVEKLKEEIKEVSGK